MEYDDTIDGDVEMKETDDDCKPMETEKDIDLMDTDEESDLNDFQSVRDSDIEFMMMSQKKNSHSIDVLRTLFNLLEFCCL